MVNHYEKPTLVGDFCFLQFFYQGKSLTIVHHHLGNMFFDFFQPPFPQLRCKASFALKILAVANGWLVRNFVVSFAPEAEGLPHGYPP